MNWGRVKDFVSLLANFSMIIVFFFASAWVATKQLSSFLLERQESYKIRYFRDCVIKQRSFSLHPGSVISTFNQLQLHLFTNVILVTGKKK